MLTKCLSISDSCTLPSLYIENPLNKIRIDTAWWWNRSCILVKQVKCIITEQNKSNPTLRRSQNGSTLPTSKRDVVPPRAKVRLTSECLSSAGLFHRGGVWPANMCLRAGSPGYRYMCTAPPPPPPARSWTRGVDTSSRWKNSYCHVGENGEERPHLKVHFLSLLFCFLNWESSLEF